MEILLDYKRINSPVFELYDLLDSEDYIIETYDPETMVMTGESTVTSDTNGTLIVSFPGSLNDTVFFKVYPDSNHTDYDNSWAEYVTLVRPYVDPANIAIKFNIPVDQAVDFEKTARQIIDDITGGFHIENKVKTVIGNGLDYLPVNERIVLLESLKENGTTIWNTTDSWNEEYSVSNDKTSIVMVNQADRKEYKTVWSTRYSEAVFGLNNDYEVAGKFGWAFVPNNIQEATMYLIEDQVCGNTRHIERYINNIRTDGYSLQYVDAAFTGTGNSMVDRILSKYKKVNINPGVL